MFHKFRHNTEEFMDQTFGQEAAFLRLRGAMDQYDCIYSAVSVRTRLFQDELHCFCIYKVISVCTALFQYVMMN